MVKYTDEMWLNDRLWESEPEDSDLMLKLFHEILYQARKLGFKNPIEIYEAMVMSTLMIKNFLVKVGLH